MRMAGFIPDGSDEYAFSWISALPRCFSGLPAWHSSPFRAPCPADRFRARTILHPSWASKKIAARA